MMTKARRQVSRQCLVGRSIEMRLLPPPQAIPLVEFIYPARRLRNAL
jgi:hypothetical protein